MRRLTRAACPPAFIPLAAAEFARARLHFEGTGRQGGFDFTAYSHDEVKSALKHMNSGKCAYCEADYDTTQPLDVEHFRPKGGIETDDGMTKPGYWWLAASWDNLLPSCIRCNRRENLELFDGSPLKAGKGNQFPLVDEKRRANAIGGEVYEHPLLIDPCREDPASFIRFVNKNGDCLAVPVNEDPTSISAQRARASIDIYGLNRAGLVRDRSRYMIRAKRALARIELNSHLLDRLSPDDEELRIELEQAVSEELEFLAELTCGEDRFTGMLYAVIEPALAKFNLSV